MILIIEVQELDYHQLNNHVRLCCGIIILNSIREKHLWKFKFLTLNSKIWCNRSKYYLVNLRVTDHWPMSKIPA